MVCVAECLTHFTEVEELEETELYMCAGCKKRQRSTKKFWIRRLPNVSSPILCHCHKCDVIYEKGPNCGTNIIGPIQTPRMMRGV